MLPLTEFARLCNANHAAMKLPPTLSRALVLQAMQFPRKPCRDRSSHSLQHGRLSGIQP